MKWGGSEEEEVLFPRMAIQDQKLECWGLRMVVGLPRCVQEEMRRSVCSVWVV